MATALKRLNDPPLGCIWMRGRWKRRWRPLGEGHSQMVSERLRLKVGLYALGVGTMGIAPSPSVIQLSFCSSSRCSIGRISHSWSISHLQPEWQWFHRCCLQGCWEVGAELGGGSIPLHSHWAILSFRVAVVVQGSRLNRMKD